MGIDEIKALLKLDGITWEESINTVDKMSPRKYRVRIQYAATNFFYPFVGGYGMTEEEAWQDAWGRYERRRAKSTAREEAWQDAWGRYERRRAKSTAQA